MYDFADRADPVQIGEYRTPNSLGIGAVGAGDYSIHNPLVVGQTLYASWYSDGIRVLDVSDPTSPTEIASFVPPAGRNPVKPPQRSVLSQMPQMWGVLRRRPRSGARQRYEHPACGSCGSPRSGILDHSGVSAQVVGVA